jgi:protein-S-isoprenylcysteine O-methyltransferase Ste14
MQSSTTRASSRWSEFRARGGAWVVAQFAVMGLIGVGWLLPPQWPDPVRWPVRIVGFALVLLGLGLALWAQRALGRAFTPFPTPASRAARTESGPYRHVRHPMYGGGILVFSGISFARSVPSLVLTVGLVALWRAKSAVEERALAERFPEYEDYRRRTPRRFLPWLG